MRSLGLVLVVLAAVAGGCGGDGDGDGGNSGGAKGPTATSGPSPTGTSSDQGGALPDARKNEDPTRKTRSRKARSRKARSERKASGRQGGTPGSRRVERYLRDNFGGGGGNAKTSWYDHVVEVVVSGATTVLRTDLSGNPAGRSVARQICMDVRGSIPGLTDTVEVTSLAARSPLARCVP